ncbi:SRPBCC family protein [Agromyces sp. NPDC056523]|uniref:SRPBCC family protein n=1 Tax=Agromyces sp. NPDC056523 TaxID=3345850 RepID=UPI003670DEC6
MVRDGVSVPEAMMWIEASVEVHRPIGKVFAWYADDHVRNHPRWDPDIELEATSDAPIAMGTVIRRRNVRSGAPVDGTMEVVEFERDRTFGVLIREGGYEMPGRASFESVDPSTTSVTIAAEVPDTVDEALITDRMQRSAENIKALMEDEL